MSYKNKLPKAGDRVKVVSLNQKGTIFYVNNRSLYVHHQFPIQIELDQPYDPVSSIQRMYRTNLKDIKRLKKKTEKPFTKTESSTIIKTETKTKQKRRKKDED